MLRKSAQRKDGQYRIGLLNRAADQFRGGSLTSGRHLAKPNEVGNIALHAARERNIDLARRDLLEKSIPRGGNNADNLYALGRCLVFAHVVAHTDVTFVALRNKRSTVGILNELAERVAGGPELFGKNVVDDGDRRTLLVCRFARGEASSTQDRQSDCRKVVAADAVPLRVECESFGRGRRLRVRSRRDTRPLNIP